MAVCTMLCGHGYYAEPDTASWQGTAAEFDAYRAEADALWQQEVDAHHAYCCEASQRGEMDVNPVCYVRDDEHCPVLNRG